ncbi:hypothetical protein V8C34DRAFT_317429 [Trichoderma compactum]
MTANATISRGTLHSYPPARGIKNEHDAPDFPSQLSKGHDPRIHSAVHNARYGEGNRTGYIPFPVYYDPSQLPISAASRYPSEVSPFDYSHTGGAMPSEEPNDDALEEEYSDPPSKKRKTQKKEKKIPVLPEHLSHFKSSLSQIAAAEGFNQALLEDAKRYVHRSTQEASLLCAVSWHRESKEFRKKFAKMAKADSANQLIAYPDYKYAPSKSGKKDDKLAKGRTSTKTARVTRKRNPASKVKELGNFSEEVLQRAIDEQQSLPAEAVHPQPYWTPVAVETYPAPFPGEHAVYHGPHLYQTQTHYITYDNGYSQGKISSPFVVYGLYEGTENPDVNYNEGCIDPALLELPSDVVPSCQPGVVYNYSVQIQRQSQPAPIEKSHVETCIPSWDDDEHAPFLSGTDDDWKTKVLNAGELTRWMTQVEAQEV